MLSSCATMSSFLLLLAFTLSPAPTLSMTQFDVPELRELTRKGNTSLEYIMGVVMMSLPEQLMTRLQAKLQSLQFPSDRGSGVSPGIGSGLPNPFGSFPFSRPSNQGATDVVNNLNSINNVNDDNSDAGDITNFNSDKPILLGVGRKKRSFGIFDNSRFHSSPFHSAGTFSGFETFHHNGDTYAGFSDDVHPGGQNRNLFGGTATGYINYPGSGHHHSKHNSFHGSHFANSGGFNRENCPRQADQGFVYQYDVDPLTYPALKSSNVTCLFKEDQVWSYQSQIFSGRCFPLVNFQELPLFRTCLNRFCKRCGGLSKPDYFWGYSATHSANVCVTEFTPLSLWSYCVDLRANQRIVRDRILVPSACTCTTVPCPPYSRHHK